ncbi:MAG: ABC transporter permease [Synergistales bacterium]|nr:ABC transporter permease [Synergistales bacterium]
MILVTVIMGLCGLLTVLEPRFLTGENLINILRQSSIIGVVALGMTCVILVRGIDLSVGSTLALSSLIAASAVQAGVPWIGGWFLALAVGAICGGISGGVVAWLGVPPFIVTLGMMGTARGAALLYTGGAPISGFPASFRVLGTGWIAAIPVPIVVFLCVYAVLHILLEHSLWGEQIRSIGSNPVAAWGTGMNVPLYTTSVFALSGMLSALAGLVLLGRLDAAQPTAGAGYEFGAIAAVVLGGTQFSGGKGTLLGTVMGVLIMGIVSNGINILNINPFYEQVVRGMVIALALIAYGRLGGSPAGNSPY